MTTLRFKVASEASELDQIHRLNHATFVDEIPLHPRPVNGSAGQLIDRFHDQNTYFVALYGDRVIGMIALRGQRPFSLDSKLDDLDAYLPAGRTVCEVRLLAVEPGHRRGPVFRGLLRALIDHGAGQGYDLAVISGTVRQLKLYSHLGFQPFGPLVGPADARFQPMFATLESIQERGKALDLSHARQTRRVRLLPGPVPLHRDVSKALALPPVSHRGPDFLATFRRIKSRLCELTGAKRVALLFGSGTLANDAIAARIGVDGGSGLILSNGEFGERLADHARRFQLPHTVLRTDWGEVFDYAAIENRLAESGCDWLWAVHCETSTGILNDVEALKAICRRRGVRLHLDCISSLATVPLDLSGVHLASGASGKGLGSFAGVSMVFHQDPIAPAPSSIPRYLDLGCYEQDGVPYTFSSNLVNALAAALDRFRLDERHLRTVELSGWLRAALRERGLRIVAPDEHASPAVTTIELPPGRSEHVGGELERRGFELSYLSGYLIDRSWIQVCLMGECSREDLEPLPDLLAELTGLEVARQE